MADSLAMQEAPPLGYAPRRSAVGVGGVVALHLLLLWGLMNGLAERLVEVVKAPIQTRLIEEVRPEPPPPPPSLPPPPLAPPPLVTQVPVPVVTPQTPPPVQAPPPPVAPPPPAPTAPPPDIHPTAPPAPPAPPPQAGTAARNPDLSYSGELRGYVNSIKRYPTSREARQSQPEGTVRLWLEIDRAGQLIASGVEASSGVLLLDQEALRTVRNGRFPPFPADAFVNESKHRFVIAMEYLKPGS